MNLLKVIINLKIFYLEKNKIIQSYETGVFLCGVLYTYEDDELFKEILDLIYTNSIDNKKINFNDIVTTIIEAEFYNETSNKLYVLKQNIENKIKDPIIWDKYNDKYKICLEYEELKKGTRT